ncbi:DUF4132 domain-containing protein [Catellatospora sichuanensis]|uniref:DUF4132 domain-containing protein n=1 Tax=Catellatospora sichuanensis TaxID=1969805 RepID=UPI001183D57D|nr:DUF4132 domain-containing protein [Catellatospora sichuanensis]
MFEHPGGALALMALIHRARKAAAAADLAAMRETAGHLLRQLDGDTLVNADEQEMNRLYDEAFPLADPGDPADVLDAPWPTTARMQALSKLLDERSFHERQLDPLVDAALDAGDLRVLRVVALTPLGRIQDASWALLLDALQAAGELGDEIVARVVADEDLIRDLVDPADPVVAAATGDRFRPAWDEHVWQLIHAPDVDWDRVLIRPRPRGLRFVRWALDFTGNWRVARHLGAAQLTAAERTQLIELLRDAPTERQEQAFTLRLAAGDAQALLPLLGLAGAERLLRLIQSGQAVNRVVRNDRAAILAAAAEARDVDLGRLLKLATNDVVAAALGLRRRPIMTRVGKDSPVGITAYGMLPLADGETVLDRWVALREVHRRGMKMQERRRQHAAAVNVGLEHLAQVGGFADAAALDAAGEADRPTPVPPPLAVGPYTATVGFDGSEPAIVAVKGARVLKSMPKAVREDPGIEPLREQHELLRGHTERLRTMLHRLVTTGTPLPPAELARLSATPAGTALLPLLVWQDAGGRFGLLDDVDVTGPVTAAHPAALAVAGLLGDWQAEAARRRLCQPVPQLFREWYAPTPQEAAGAATRLSDRVIGGDAAARELTVRGWSVHDGAQPYATREFGTRTAVLHVVAAGCWGAGDVAFTRLEFRDADAPVAADAVPAAVFSEAMRDLDRTAWVGRRSVGDYPTGLARARAELLAAVLGDDAKRITRHGDTVVVNGSRAVYRVHLGTEAVTVGSRRHPCDLPYVFGDTPHRALFPIVDGRDRSTLCLLTRILLLAEDEKITDEWTLDKLGLVRRTTEQCSACGRFHHWP